MDVPHTVVPLVLMIPDVALLYNRNLSASYSWWPHRIRLQTGKFPDDIEYPFPRCLLEHNVPHQLNERQITRVEANEPADASI